MTAPTKGSWTASMEKEFALFEEGNDRMMSPILARYLRGLIASAPETRDRLKEAELLLMKGAASATRLARKASYWAEVRVFLASRRKEV